MLERWISKFERSRLGALRDLKKKLEGDDVGPKSDCVRVNVSDWKPGSSWENQRLYEARTVDIVGTVVESDPPRRLVSTWARPADAKHAAKHSRVAIDIEPHIDGLVRLTLNP